MRARWVSKSVSVITLSLLLLAMAASIKTSFVVAAPRILRVPSEYSTIQVAVDAASSGDTILIAPGTYYERVGITKTVNIYGEKQETTIVDGQQKGPILNITASYVQVKNLTIQNGKYYVAIWAETPPAGTIISVSVTNCTFIGNYVGVTVVHGLGVTIIQNTFLNNQIGVQIGASNLMTVTNNRIDNCLYQGIYLHTRTGNSTVSFNMLTNNKYGILIDNSNKNNITLNDIVSATSKSGYGIRITTSQGNRIVGNTMGFNYYGIVLWANATNNRIYHNNFINNTLQQYHYNTTLTANIWDTDVNPGAQGNYWSDYTGIDNGSGVGRWGEPRVAGDGIGDTLIPHQSVDYYPLIHPWSPYPIASFTFTPDPPHVEETVTFDATASSGDIISYKWSFGDGSPEVTESDPITTHVYQAVGNYTVTLTVTTRDSFTNSTSKTVSVLSFRLVLDVYTQREPFSGKGFNQSSDAFAPQELVMLYGLVTYNDAPVPDKLVSFNVYDPNGTLLASRSNTTNADGIAVASFRLENNATFGTYLVIGSVEVAGHIAEDYLRFEVGWIINIVGLETVDNLGDPKIEFRKGEAVFVNIFLRNIASTPRDVTLTIVMYDEKSQPVAVTAFQTTVDSGWAELKSAFTLSVPDWGLVGLATIYANALTDWSWNQGVPYCPENSINVTIRP